MRKYGQAAEAIGDVLDQVFEELTAPGPDPFDEEIAETPREALRVADPEIPANDTITFLVPTAITDIATIFTPGGSDPILKEIRAAVDKVRPLLDVSTVRGREMIRSTARRVATTKARLEDLGKAQADKAKELPKIIDAERRRIKEELEALQDDVRAPLTAFEEKEMARVEGHEAAIKEIADHAHGAVCLWSHAIKDLIKDVEYCNAGRDFQEFQDRADKVRADTLSTLRSLYAQNKKSEDDRAELERLREADRQREEAERKAAEDLARAKRDEELRKAAEERGRRQAEEKASEERRAAEMQAARLIAEVEDARVAAERHANEARAREEQARTESKRLADLAEVNRIAAEARHKRELEEARADEQCRAQAKAEADAALEQKRIANKKHVATVHADILNALKTCIRDEQDALSVLEAITTDQIPHVGVSY